MNLELQKLVFGYDSARPLLDGLSLSFAPGKLVFLLGANGAGKSTLLKLISGIIHSYRGNILLDDRDLRTISANVRARHIGIALQNPPSPLGYTVREIAMLGRTPKLPRFGAFSSDDKEAVEEALGRMHLLELADREADTLSGGEWQRLKLAALLALQSEVLLLDEPFSAQDPVQAEHCADCFRILSEKHIVIIVSHDLNLARTIADRVIMLKDGRCLADGSPEEVLNPRNILECYGKG